MKPAFKVIDLGTLPGGAMSRACGLNDLGQVVGWSSVRGFDFCDGFVWEGGTLTALGTSERNGGSFPAAINGLGQVIGYTRPSAREEYEGTPHMAFLWEKGRLQFLPPVENGELWLTDLNVHGEIVGRRVTWQSRTTGRVQGRESQSFLWCGGTTTDLLASGWNLGGAFEVGAINNAGVVAGGAYREFLPVGEGTQKAYRHACLWDNEVITDLGSLGHDAQATNLNDMGQVVGRADMSLEGDAHAFFWESGVMRDLGTLPGRTESEAHAINNQGQVVGVSSNYETRVGSVNVRSFLWQAGQMIDLNTLIDPAVGWEILEAVDINDQGQIACNGSRSDGTTHGLLLDPL